MNAIMGIADLLAKTALSPEQDKYVQIFRRAGDNLLNLINDILDLSKVEASSLEEPEVPMRNQSPQSKAHRPSVLLYSNGKASKP